jgi:hypothetical protein
MLGALDLALWAPYFAVSQGEVLVAAPVAHGVEVIIDADERDP